MSETPTQETFQKPSMKRLSREDALPCPFCGSQPTIESWHGGRPTKKMIACDADDCDVAPMVTGETKREALARWNRRHV